MKKIFEVKSFLRNFIKEHYIPTLHLQFSCPEPRTTKSPSYQHFKWRVISQVPQKGTVSWMWQIKRYVKEQMVSLQLRIQPLDVTTCPLLHPGRLWAPFPRGQTPPSESLSTTGRSSSALVIPTTTSCFPPGFLWSSIPDHKPLERHFSVPESSKKSFQDTFLKIKLGKTVLT